jgi:hypothetical protein
VHGLALGEAPVGSWPELLCNATIASYLMCSVLLITWFPGYTPWGKAEEEGPEAEARAHGFREALGTPDREGLSPEASCFAS